MNIPYAIAGVVLLLTILWDAFETIVLPRRVHRKLRLTRLFYRYTWMLWKGAVGCLPSKRRELHLSYYGPLSLLVLLGVWAVGLVVAFGILHYSTGSSVTVQGEAATGFWTDVYLSGTTFFTLGLGDVIPRGTLARVLVVTEGGMGFGFLAVVIGYLPVIYQAFSRREVSISMLDARAGSPPSAGELLRRHAAGPGPEALRQLLAEWERTASELMESHLSYSSLCYFRSQHSNQSWLAALTTILDASAFLIVTSDGPRQYQARLTFAIARHATVDLAQIFVREPQPPESDRLPRPELARLQANLAAAGYSFRNEPDMYDRLEEMRKLYEPFVYSLGIFLCMDLPPWIPSGKLADNWQTTAWNKDSALSAKYSLEGHSHEDHF